MGYAAEQVDGASIIIADGQAFWEALKLEACSTGWPGFNRFSWTEEVDTYIARHGDGGEAAVEMLAHYGFDDLHADGEGTLYLHSWGGDKIGMSWDDVWGVIAAHADPYEWVMSGEDGRFWREDNPGNVRRTTQGKIVF